VSLRLALLTTGRQDWGILRSTCLALRQRSQIDLHIFAGGMHASREFGDPLSSLQADNFVPSEVFSWLDRESSRTAYGQAGVAVQEIGESLARLDPQALILLGDRYETLSAAFAATLARIPVIHVHGGEETEGAFDNAFRHAITKLSHLHFVSHPQHARRVIAMGEDPSTVHVVGAPGLDNFHRQDLPNRGEMEKFLGLPLQAPVVLVTLHPATWGAKPEDECRALITALDRVPATYVITLPNSDPGADTIRSLLKAAERPGRVVVKALGDRHYWGLLKFADAMAGNSSSGIIEAPLLELPVVNVGDRQRGRLRGNNVLDAAPETKEIEKALRKALTPEFRAGLRDQASPYGDGRSGERIAEVLASWRPPSPPVKKWHGPDVKNKPKDIVIVGGGEHARVVIEAAKSRSDLWNVVGFVDPLPESRTRQHLGVRCLGDDPEALAVARNSDCGLVLGVGGTAVSTARRGIVERYGLPSERWAAVIHSDAWVSSTAHLEPGVTVLAGAIVNSGARIGAHTIINSGAIVEHDVHVGAFAHVGPGVVVGGGASIGEEAFLGLGCRIRDHVDIGPRTLIGMGAAVVASVPEDRVMMGVPAKTRGKG
jgi:UDP-hydrolysing UDP-N-acetyl-D-glucosamine 2-epimerase